MLKLNKTFTVLVILNSLIPYEFAIAAYEPKCHENWVQVMSVRAIGQKCKLLTDPLSKKLDELQSKNYKCATEKATEAERLQYDEQHIAKTEQWITKSIEELDCSNEKSKNYFNEQVKKLPQ